MNDFGNMLSDQNKGITSIEYNHLNLPRRINFATGGNIIYIYNAQGVKLQKTVTTHTTQSITRYRGGYQYDNTTLQFVQTSEGYVRHTANPTNGSVYGAFDYVYNYTDHLGNIRLSYVLDPSGEGLKVIEEIDEGDSMNTKTKYFPVNQNHYNPFGLKHTYNLDRRDIGYFDHLLAGTLDPTQDTRRTRMVSNNGYQYKYNGNEWQDELGLNLYDMNARQYDPAIGRFTSIDVMAEGDADLTPYRFGYNNPVLFSGPTGLWEEVDGGHKTSDKDEIQRIYAFLQNNQNASMDQISNFVNEDIAFMSQYNEGLLLTGIVVQNGVANNGTVLRTQNEIDRYLGYTDYLYNSADIRKRNQILEGGGNDPISNVLLNRESEGNYKPINAANGIKYRGGYDSSMLINFGNFMELMPGMDGPIVASRARLGIKEVSVTPSAKIRVAGRMKISFNQIDEIKGMSYRQFEKSFKHLYVGKFKGRGTWRTHMGMDFRIIKNL